jgi:hypothetical protein
MIKNPNFQQTGKLIMLCKPYKPYSIENKGIIYKPYWCCCWCPQRDASSIYWADGDIIQSPNRPVLKKKHFNG